jgi:hypothetical protein
MSLPEASGSPVSVFQGWQGLNQPTAISKASRGLKRNLPTMHQSVISCGYDSGMTSTPTAIKVGNGYIYRGVHIKRDDYYTNGQQWAYTFAMRTNEPNYELCRTLRGAKMEIDALIDYGNYIAKDDWLYHPSCEEVN